MTQVRLIDASFIWTEPHSRRIKIKLVVQKEIQEGAILEQTVPVSNQVQDVQNSPDVIFKRVILD